MNRIFLFLFIASIRNPLAAQEIDINIDTDVVSFHEGGDSIMVFQVADKSLNGSHKRSNYIHPLYSLDGQILTEDFPADHLHHRGIFWAWHQLYTGDKRIGDGWD